MSAIERHLRVQRHARLYVLGSPEQARELWIVCHGYGQLASSFVKALEPVAGEGRIVAAPEALNRFYLDDPNKRHGADSPVGATWMTREDREAEIADYVAYLDTVASTVREEIGALVPIVALGFSQGVATVCRWSALGRTQIARLVLWGGTLPVDLPPRDGVDLFRGADVVMVAGRKDSLVTPDALEKDQAELARRGIRATLLRFDGGHALNTDTLRRLATGTQ